MLLENYKEELKHFSKPVDRTNYQDRLFAIKNKLRMKVVEKEIKRLEDEKMSCTPTEPEDAETFEW